MNTREQKKNESMKATKKSNDPAVLPMRQNVTTKIPNDEEQESEKLEKLRQQKTREQQKKSMMNFKFENNEAQIFKVISVGTVLKSSPMQNEICPKTSAPEIPQSSSRIEPLVTTSAPLPTPVKKLSFQSVFEVERFFTREKSTDARWEALKTIHSSQGFPALFKDSLEPELFMQIACVLRSRLPEHLSEVSAMFGSLSNVPRIDTLKILLTDDESSELSELCSLLPGYSIENFGI
eukprot:GDKJ01049920.1.p1 GENE.GDKJ01049920.1~~GDKJ01049920.1.p1  ORF type:complete len:272 (-),score=55.51 GDKJ01049920.1:145-852(-)